jgi:heptosyltransferase II
VNREVENQLVAIFRESIGNLDITVGQSYTVRPKALVGLNPSSADQAALGMLVKMSARKRLLVRWFDAVARPLISAWDRLFRRVSNHANAEVNRILVMEYWNLGDIVMMTPFLASLRIQFPNAHITLLTSPKAAPLLQYQGLVDQVAVVMIPWAQHYSRLKKYNPFSLLWMDLFRTVRSFRHQNIDLAFVARPDVRDNSILWFLRAKRRVGYAFGGGGYFLTDAVVPDLQRPHFSDRWLNLLNAVGKAAVTREPCLKLTAQEQEGAKSILAEKELQKSQFLVGIHPGARNILRKWGEDNFATLARRLEQELPVKFVWFLDPGQPAPEQAGMSTTYLSLPMREFMAVLAECDMLICNDSGPMHIATALQVPVVAIFGPTEPAWFGPIGQNHRVVMQPGFWCRPCFDYCHFDQPYCMRVITVDAVFQAAMQTLSLLSGKPNTAGGTVRATDSKSTEAGIESSRRMS